MQLLYIFWQSSLCWHDAWLCQVTDKENEPKILSPPSPTRSLYVNVGEILPTFSSILLINAQFLKKMQFPQEIRNSFFFFFFLILFRVENVNECYESN